MEHVISIGPSGLIKAMHNDKVDLSSLGHQRIERASDIRWDEEDQSWAIWFNIEGRFIAPSPEYRGFPSYDAARTFEVDIMNKAMLLGVNPLNVDILIYAGLAKL